MAGNRQNVGLAEVIREAIRSKIAQIHTTAPGVVVTYDRDTQAATVQLTVRGRRIDPRTKARSTYVHRPIVSVPVVMPGTARAGFTIDLEPGDPVLVHFSERDVSKYLATGGDDVAPVDPRRHALTDAFCTPGAFPFAGPQRPGNAVAAGAAVLYGDDVRLGSADASSLIALADLVDSRLDDITLYMKNLKLAYDLHTHIETGGATLPGTPLAPEAVEFDSVAAEKVRAE